MVRGQESHVEEYLRALQQAADQLTQEINSSAHPENIVDVRLGEVNASIQRLAWAMERSAQTRTARGRAAAT